jgi:alpha-beta hydrolase superfamily lysophospholipase
VDYFFQTHLADFYEAQGIRFYAVDLRRHGRSLRPHQLLSFTRDITEYLDDVTAAVQLLVAEEGVEWLLLNGHSTGGLVAALFAHRGRGREHAHALALNSPFLDMNLPAWQQRFLEPVLAQVGRLLPKAKLPLVPSVYGESIHADHRGSWRFDTTWKPVTSVPIRLGWVSAIHRAQGEVADGLGLAQPIQVLHASQSLWALKWVEGVRHADIVLNVDDMRRLGPTLGSNVELAAIDNGIHDLALSQDEARHAFIQAHAAWLARVAPR